MSADMRSSQGRHFLHTAVALYDAQGSDGCPPGWWALLCGLVAITGSAHFLYVVLWSTPRPNRLPQQYWVAGALMHAPTCAPIVRLALCRVLHAAQAEYDEDDSHG